MPCRRHERAWSPGHLGAGYGSGGMTTAVTYEIIEGIAIVSLDDGKANAFGPQNLAALDAAIDAAETEARALVIMGRPGRFCAGFDLSVIEAGGQAARELVGAGARTAMALYGSSVPVVVACTGHALAFGAILLLASDLRIGADVDAKIGMNEVAIGLSVPIFAMELARARLSPRYLTQAIALATLYTPSGAVKAGFLDEVVPSDELEQTVLQRARGLADGLSPSGFSKTRRNDRQGAIDHIEATLDEDLADFGLDT